MKLTFRNSVLLAAVLAGCAAPQETRKESPQDEVNRRISERLQEARRERALNHFIQGAVYEAKGEHANAVLEYQDALRDDPNPAIHYALSKNYSQKNTILRRLNRRP